jgi:hypothetical protein
VDDFIGQKAVLASENGPENAQNPTTVGDFVE